MSNDDKNGYAILILRVALGVLFLAHAWLKIGVFTLPGTAAFFEQVGLWGFLAYPVFLIEVAGGLLLLAGLFTRWAALGVGAVALGATTVHWPNGWVFNVEGGGWEFPAALAVVCVALFLLGGDGAWSLAARLEPALSRATRGA